MNNKTMDEKTAQMIKERFDALPKMIQEVILSTNYEETLLEIGKKYNLNVEQLGILERETTLVMMGLTPTKDFETELTRELNVDKIKGFQIVKDINEKVFLKIRELLKLMNTPAGEEPSLEQTEAEKEHDIFKSAGIEIVPEKLEINSPLEEYSTHKVEGGGESIPAKATPQEGNVHPILTQKLSGFVKNNVVETDHSLENITKETKTDSVKADVPKKVDPYREIPE